jgi:hypothetical protein
LLFDRELMRKPAWYRLMDLAGAEV